MECVRCKPHGYKFEGICGCLLLYSNTMTLLGRGIVHVAVVLRLFMFTQGQEGLLQYNIATLHILYSIVQK